MSIPESQLETWSSQGAITTSASTYATIRNALEAKTAMYADKEFEIFLQGSYGNDTNIYAESDVDIVILLKSSFYRDISRLSASEQEAYRAQATSGTYDYKDYKNHVEAALRKVFGASVECGKKSIKVKADGSRRNADVIPAFQYRFYKYFDSSDSSNPKSYDEGISFFDQADRQIINYPKAHSANLTLKHQKTNGMFKPMARIFKNIRTRLVDDEIIDAGLAPSYFIEGMLYNVPNEKFTGNYKDAFVACKDWLIETDRTNFLCANMQQSLFGNTSVTWTEENCQKFLKEVSDLWDGWNAREIFGSFEKLLNPWN
ncbi:MAG: nucleotidyltransferase [bacterium]